MSQYDPDQLVAYRTEALQRKSELEDLKKKGGQSWNRNLQSELESIVVHMVEVDDIMDQRGIAEGIEAGTPKAAEVEEAQKEQAKRENIGSLMRDAATEKPAYTPRKGSEKMVHLRLIFGRRFDSQTGKEISKPYIQMYSYPEWQLFKSNFKGLGYTIVEVLHDPYNEAAEYVDKTVDLNQVLNN